MRTMKLVFVAVVFLSAAPVVGQVDLAKLANYANQPVPDYITKDNTPVDNPITDEGANLGRILFFDRALASNNAVACSSCHFQSSAFSDFTRVSFGVNGATERHSMRLINGRFAESLHFLWDERALTLEEQTTMPIHDHAELGFSGTQGDGDIDDLIEKLEGIPYYDILFTQAFGDPAISEDRMQRAMAQFVRSIQSFDSKYDEGRAQVSDELTPFPNFTAEENAGKLLFNTDFKTTPGTANGIPVAVRVSGGLNCSACHRPPEFDIDPGTQNNGIIDMLLSNEPDPDNTRSPSLRDLLNAEGNTNGGAFHTGLPGEGIKAVTEHYNLPFDPTHGPNPSLDPRLKPDGNPQFLDITTQEEAQLEAFIRTLTGTDVYTNPKWSNPFQSNGDLVLVRTTAPESYEVTRGTYASGDETNLAESDNSDLSVRRANTDVQSRVEIEVESTSVFDAPEQMTFIVEASVFARSEVTQSVELFNHLSESWEQVDSRIAAQFSDATTEIQIPGDVSRFISGQGKRVLARVSFVSINPRQRFSANVDVLNWKIQQRY